MPISCEPQPAESGSQGYRAFAFGTKAETLERIAPLLTLSQVLGLYHFTAAAWADQAESLLDVIQSRFPSQRVILRSSALGEDQVQESLAGAFKSCLNVSSSDRVALRQAIDSVVASFHGDGRDQVLVQPMLEEINVCGVIMTHDLDTGAPYYILNYDDESGRTDRVTGGQGVNKTVVIHRDCAISNLESQRIARLLEMTRELEQICGGRDPLDIEFATLRNDQIILLQVRRISVQKNWNRRAQRQITEAVFQVERFFEQRSCPRPGMAGTRTLLGQMPDWNPAELLGTSPKPLALSLFRYLISDEVWRDARRRIGYRPLPDGETLVVALGGRPYVDVRNSFNSFLPKDLDEATAETLVEAWLTRLSDYPELHDKVEFEVAQTAMDFTFESAYRSRYGNLLSPAQFQNFRERLRVLTHTCLSRSSLQWALQQIQALDPPPHATASPSLWRVFSDLGHCREFGTLPFAMVARHAFIAEALLRSAVSLGALHPERLDAFKRSLNTVTKELSFHHHLVQQGRMTWQAFLDRYGHLRPGTFDLLSPRYDQRTDLFEATSSEFKPTETEPFTLKPSEKHALSQLLHEAELGDHSPEALMGYAGLAISQRENTKFHFSRSLSSAMEHLAEWGERMGLNRDELTHLTLADLRETLHQSFLEEPESSLRDLVEGRRKQALVGHGLRLGYLIRSVADLYVIPLHRSAPNFIGRKSVFGPTLKLDSHSSASANLRDKIICVENADPGFDWIFTRGIKGLITQFGGANSHMTIRCAELNLPAAIGVGEQTFDRMVQAGCVELDCAAKTLRPVYA